jgi:hypothetical protein
MALHRDIFWVGRQWAVTGFGIQAVDQRLRGVLDIEIARLWDVDLVASRRAKPGVNVEDFDKALSMARTRWPQGPAPDPVALKPAPIRQEVRPAAAPPAKAPAEVDSLIARLSQLELPQIPEPPATTSAAPPAAPVRPTLALRAEGKLARFLPQWRIRR